MSGVNCIGPLDRAGVTNGAEETRNDSAAAFKLNDVANKLIEKLGIVGIFNKGSDPTVQLGILREALQLYADKNNISPDVLDIVSKNAASKFDVSGGLPKLEQAARSNANSVFPTGGNGGQDPLARRLENMTIIEGKQAARDAVNNIDRPSTASGGGQVYGQTSANLANKFEQLANSLATILTTSLSTQAPKQSITAPARANNGGSELQNARGEVDDIRRTLGTDTEIATTGKKNMALAKLDTAIDKWAKDNNVPAGIVSLVKSEIASDIGTYNGKLTTSNDEANRLALEKFPVKNDFIFGDTNASARANYANQIKSNIDLEASAAVSVGSSGVLSMLNQTMNAVNDLRDILGTDKEISSSGKKNAALAKLDAAIDAWGAANNVPAGTLALAKSRTAQDFGTYNGKLTTLDDEANRLAMEKFPPNNSPFLGLFGDVNANNRANFVAEYKKDVANQAKAAVNELNFYNEVNAPQDNRELLGNFERLAARNG